MVLPVRGHVRSLSISFQAVREKLKEHHSTIAFEAGKEMPQSELVDAAVAEKLERG